MINNTTGIISAVAAIIGAYIALYAHADRAADRDYQMKVAIDKIQREIDVVPNNVRRINEIIEYINKLEPDAPLANNSVA